MILVYIHIYIYKYKYYVCMYVFFNPVDPELRRIPLAQLNYLKFEYLNIPGKELIKIT